MPPSHKSTGLILQADLKANKMEFSSATESHTPQPSSDTADAIMMEKQNFIRFKQQMEQKPVE